LETALVPQSSLNDGSPERVASQLAIGAHATNGAQPSSLPEGEGSLWLSLASGNVKIPYFALQYFLSLIDAVLIIAASLVGSGLYQIVATGEFSNADHLLGAGIVSALLYVAIGLSGGFYDISAAFSKRKDAARILAQWSLVGLLLALLAFLMKSGAVFSRGSVICFGSLALLSLLVCRRFSKRLVSAAVTDGQVQGRRAIVLGTRDELGALAPRICLGDYRRSCQKVQCAHRQAISAA
jgi:hypothetical protein